MFYVYMLQSTKHKDKTYVGFTKNVETRLKEHNSGKSFYTSSNGPWEVIVSVAFRDEKKAKEFEKYLKNTSGKSFAKKHFL